MSEPASLLVVGRYVITMNAAHEIFVDAGVAIHGDRIVDVGPAAELRERYPAATVLGDATATVAPGYVNTHQHLTGDRLVRASIPDDLPPGESIFSWVVPVHAAHTPEDDELAATLGLVEAVTNGITTTVEAGTVAHPDRVAAAMRRVGVRGTVGTWGWDVGDGPFVAPAAEVLARQRDVLAGYPPGSTVTGWVTLVGHDLMSDALVSGASELARAAGVGLTFHMSPSAADAGAYLDRTGSRPLVHLERLGVLGGHVLLGHAVHLDDAECEAVLRTDTAIAYAPWAYLRLGQGVTRAGRHVEIANRGGRVGLACDAENAGDQVDSLRTAALAAGLGKDMAADPTCFGAHDAYEWLTIKGAAAIGLADSIGSLEPGKAADVVVHRGTGPEFAPPGRDPILQLVWGTDGRSVRDVVVAGKVVVRSGRCTTVDADALHEAAVSAGDALLERAGITARPRWPLVRPSDRC